MDVDRLDRTIAEPVSFVNASALPDFALLHCFILSRMMRSWINCGIEGYRVIACYCKKIGLT